MRFTPYEIPCDNLSQYFERFDQYVIGFERYKKDGVTPCQPHYHIWLNADLQLESIRESFKKHMSIPSVRNGKSNKWLAMKTWDEKLEYVIKQGNIISCKGFSTEELLFRVPPCPVKKEEKIQASAAQPAVQKKKESSFWELIVETAIITEKARKEKLCIVEALKVITKVYFRKGLPLPHPSDRKRWALSLLMYSRMDWEYNENLHDKIIEENAIIFASDELTSNKPIKDTQAAGTSGCVD